MGEWLILRVFLEPRPEHDLAGVLMVGKFHVGFLGGVSEHLGEEGALFAGI